jgi:hypothetical protein
MKANFNISYVFTYNKKGAEEPYQRNFVIKFKAPFTNEYEKTFIGGEETDLADRMQDMLSDLDVVVSDISFCPDACTIGWSSYDQDQYGDALEQVHKVRDFFLSEGCSGGEIVEMSREEFQTFTLQDKTGRRYETAFSELGLSL